MDDLASEEVEILEGLLEEFATRIRRGEQPAIGEYEERFPRLAGEIRRLFPLRAILEMAVPAVTTAGEKSSLEPPILPERVGDYRILREIGRGGMGIVYEAEQLSLGRRVALKALAGRLLGAAHRERFHREARAAARLRHAHIVPVHEIGIHDDVPYYVMPLVEGQSLDRVLGRNPLRVSQVVALVSTVDEVPLSSPETPTSPLDTGDVLSQVGTSDYLRWVVGIGIDIADALAHAHAMGIIHRDIKPSNIILDRHGVVWLTDFGLAVLTGETGEAEGSLTRTGDIVGTIRFMAPERFEGWADARSDLYSLGLTLYEILTGKPAFPEKDRLRLIEQIGTQSPIALRRHNPQIPRDLETIIHKASAREPQERYASALALQADLQCFLDGRPVQARPQTPLARVWLWARRRPALAALIALTAILCVTIPVVSLALAIHMRSQRDVAEENLGRAQRAEAAIKVQREEALRLLVLGARAGRNSEELGRRFDGLAALERAARAQPEEEFEEIVRKEMRNEAIACLALVDLRLQRPLCEVSNGLRVVGDPPGHHCALLEESGRVTVRDMRTSHEIAVLPRVAPHPRAAQFSPDGRYLAVSHAANKGVLYVWDWRMAAQILLPCEGVGLSAFDFNTNSRQIAVAFSPLRVDRYDLANGTRIDSFPLTHEAGRIAFHPNGKWLAVAPRHLGHPLVVYSLTGLSTQSYRMPSQATARGIAWSPDGGLLAAASEGQGHPIVVWKTHSLDQPVGILRGHFGTPQLVRFSADGRFLGSAGDDRTFRLWDPHRERLLLSVPSGPVSDLPWDLGNGTLPLILRPGQVDVWEAAFEREAISLGMPANDRFLQGPAFSPDGRLMMAGGENGLQLWDLATGVYAGNLPIPRLRYPLFLFSGEQIITWSRRGLEVFPFLRRQYGWHIDKPRLLPLLNPILEPESLLLHPNGRVAYFVDRGQGCAQGIDLTTGQVEQATGRHLGIHSLALSPDGQFLATAARQGKDVFVWEIATKKEVGEPFRCGSAVCAWSPGGEILGHSEEARFVFRERKTGKVLFEKQRADPEVSPGPFAFHPHSPVVALALSRFRVTLLNLATGEELAVLTNPVQEPVTSLTFSPDGGRLAVGLAHRSFRVWNLRSIRAQLREMKLDWTGAQNGPDHFPSDSPPIQVTAYVVGRAVIQEGR